MACVVQLFFKGEGRDRNGQLLFHLVETEFNDFAEFLEAVQNNALISGDCLHSRRGPDRETRLVVKRIPVGFWGAALSRAELPPWKIIEEVD